MERFFNTLKRENQKLLTISLFTLMLTALLLGCTKEKATPDDQLIDTTVQLDVLSLLADTENAENHQVNQILYLFGKAIQNAAQNPELLRYMERYLEVDAMGYGVSIIEMINGNPNLNEAITSTLRQAIEADGLQHLIDMDNAVSDDNFVSKLVGNMVCKGKTYEPVIHRLVALDVTPRNQDVIIAIGEEVTDDDEVLAYRNNEEIPFLLSEEDARTSTDNIIFVGVGDIPGDDGNAIVIGDNDIVIDLDQVTIRTDIDIDVDRHQIKNGYRYESSNKSEVRCWVTKFFQGQYNPWSLSNWQDFGSRKIHKDDINSSKIFTGDLNAFGFNPTDFNNGISAFVGGWEYDWYASNKLVVNPCSNFVDHSVVVKMKFSHEWYFFDCDVANVWWPNVGSHEIFQNEKCMFDLKRTQ